MISYKYVSKFCCEDISLIENYDKAIADEKRWECHHRLETHDENGNLRLIEDRLFREDLKDLGLYYYRPASELIFMAKSDHVRLHFKGTHKSEESKRKTSNSLMGHSVSNETRQKISKACKGNESPMKGKHHTEETRKRLSEATKAYYERKRQQH